MYKTLKICALGLMAVAAVGCVTQKKLMYLQDADASKTETLNTQFKAQSELVVRSGDAMTIFISALDNEAVAPYNLPTVVYSRPGSAQVQTTPMLQYYIVDDQGDVTLPVLGKVHVAGLTRTGVEEAVRAKLEAQVVNPSV